MRLLNWTGVGAPSALQSRVIDIRGDQELHRLGWNIPPEELIYIPEHWLSYLEPPASMHFLLGLIYIGLYLAGMIGNGLVLWIFSSAKSLRTASNMFVVNLAFCDFIMMSKLPMFIYNSYYRGYALGHVGCQIFAFIGSLSGIGAGMTNAFIAYDRYTTITKPFDGKLTRMKAFLIIVGIWIYTVPWAVMPLTEFWGKFAPEGFLTACSFDYLLNTFDNHMFVACIFFCSYVVPVTMIIFFYSKIVSTVFNHEKALREQAKKMNVDSLRSNQNQGNQTAEIRIAKAAITICFLFIAAWTPYAVSSLIGAFGDQSLLTPGVTMIPAVACKFVGCLDPYVYAISHPRYRQELQKRLPWLAIKEANDETKSVASAVTQNDQEQKVAA
ncbi:hypothetical protein WA026_023798 [Henosepilachna vigintioctopunctata]|uniref:G-protein coupled receptors family 1 profile domain-containing protein n=2 Tax=Henosepilachna vigintioctopunctata TaxID=420089 RepID=A0AAW1UDR9_9CUCU